MLTLAIRDNGRGITKDRVVERRIDWVVGDDRTRPAARRPRHDCRVSRAWNGGHRQCSDNREAQQQINHDPHPSRRRSSRCPPGHQAGAGWGVPSRRCRGSRERRRGHERGAEHRVGCHGAGPHAAGNERDGPAEGSAAREADASRARVEHASTGSVRAPRHECGRVRVSHERQRPDRARQGRRRSDRRTALPQPGGHRGARPESAARAIATPA